MQWIINFTITIIVMVVILATIQAKASENIKIIWCINKITLETKQPSEKWNCYYGEGWQNIMIPPDSHINIWREVFENDEMIINRLPIVNFESWFDENASNKHAKWYVQTLRSYLIPPDILSQLKWMKDRQESQKKGNCSQHIESGENRVMRCLYARHYGALDGYHWYPNKAMKAREFYINYFKTNSF